MGWSVAKASNGAIQCRCVFYDAMESGSGQKVQYHYIIISGILISGGSQEVSLGFPLVHSELCHAFSPVSQLHSVQ